MRKRIRKLPPNQQRLDFFFNTAAKHEVVEEKPSSKENTIQIPKIELTNENEQSNLANTSFYSESIHPNSLSNIESFENRSDHNSFSPVITLSDFELDFSSQNDFVSSTQSSTESDTSDSDVLYNISQVSSPKVESSRKESRRSENHQKPSNQLEESQSYESFINNYQNNKFDHSNNIESHYETDRKFSVVTPDIESCNYQSVADEEYDGQAEPKHFLYHFNTICNIHYQLEILERRIQFGEDEEHEHPAMAVEILDKFGISEVTDEERMLRKHYLVKSFEKVKPDFWEPRVYDDEYCRLTQRDNRLLMDAIKSSVPTNEVSIHHTLRKRSWNRQDDLIYSERDQSLIIKLPSQAKIDNLGSNLYLRCNDAFSENPNDHQISFKIKNPPKPKQTIPEPKSYEPKSYESKSSESAKVSLDKPIFDNENFLSFHNLPNLFNKTVNKEQELIQQSDAPLDLPIESPIKQPDQQQTQQQLLEYERQIEELESLFSLSDSTDDALQSEHEDEKESHLDQIETNQKKNPNESIFDDYKQHKSGMTQTKLDFLPQISEPMKEAFPNIKKIVTEKCKSDLDENSEVEIENDVTLEEENKNVDKNKVILRLHTLLFDTDNEDDETVIEEF
ncbi:hypothetical protein TRFO_26773 [Tritrichomonas foetus]|uniref:Uncharacterized protein n=1 Tax=Tritrichomonas foetus TaxID=1144522 RepID=A0A1J4K724_9EUKA|nr:hypothetical protein TRFO_26773 [Tritrichomonas foetus]|eukprot:OHT05500.1 hypothetical protein TRFO_26773 [Tritrichomonas foetus]